jgi:hypothetical protein
LSQGGATRAALWLGRPGISTGYLPGLLCGDVTGTFIDSSQQNKPCAFVRDQNGDFIVFDGPNEYYSIDGYSINDRGEVTGLINAVGNPYRCVSGIIRYGVRFSAALPILDRHTAFEL